MGGIADRLKQLQEHAEDRGPLEPAEDGWNGGGGRHDPDGAFAGADGSRPEVKKLPPLNPSEPADVLFPKTAAERAIVAGGNAGLDCETALIQPGRAVPRLVVTGYQNADGTQEIVTGADGATVDADGRVVLDPAVHARGFLRFTERLIREHMVKMRTAADGMTGIARVEDAVCAWCGKTQSQQREHPESCACTVQAGGGLLINQNLSFDFVAIAESAHQADVKLGFVNQAESWGDQVLDRVFELLDLNLAECTLLRERLLDLAEGILGKNFGSLTKDGNPRRKKYALQALSLSYLNTDMEKLKFRLGYAALVDLPLTAYEPGAVEYLTHDVETALHVAKRQSARGELHGLAPGARIPNSAEQTRAQWSFALMSAWGVRTDLAKTNQLDADLDSLCRDLEGRLKKHGIIRESGSKAGTRDMKLTHKLVSDAYDKAGMSVPLTKTGRVSTKGIVLEDIAAIRLRGSSTDVLDENGQVDERDLLQDPLYCYSMHSSVVKLQNTYVKVLKSGVSRPINAGFETIVESGRASNFKPNLMNLPRGGKRTLLQRLQSRVREAFIPRPGFVFASVDFAVAELCALSELCYSMIGESKLGDTINAGLDPHLLLAAEQFLHCSYEDAVKRKKAGDKEVAAMRQLAKSASFGFPGGLGAKTFVEFAFASYGVVLSEDEARVVKQKWLATFPEMQVYFRIINSMLRAGFDDKGNAVGNIEQHVSGRIRGRTRYTAACNTLFQGLCADSAKAALYEVQRECYTRNGRMRGARPVVFVHDEIITEMPEHLASEYAWVQTEVMIKAMQDMCPHVKIRAEPALMRCWMKDAEAAYDASGKLIPWEPK